MKEKLLVFGTGECTEQTLKVVDDINEIIGYVDNDVSKQGNKFKGKIIYSPEKIVDYDFDKIVICSQYYKEIFNKLVRLGIPENKIKDRNYFHERRLIATYADENDEEISEVLNYIRQKGLKTFNYFFNDIYDSLPVEVMFDSDINLFYVVYNNRKMYMSRKFKTTEKVREYIRSVLKEQDERSPHKYLNDEIYVKENDVVVDAGVAEGNFALDVIDSVKKIYLIEADDDWIEALRYTFREDMSKVVIIKGFLSDNDEGDNVSLDTILMNEKIDFIKMDIEGAETLALKGAHNTLINNDVKLDICAYHNIDDEQKIVEILHKYGYKTQNSYGYMVFLCNDKFYTKSGRLLVRGLIRAGK